MKTIILLINFAFIATVLAAPKPQFPIFDEYGNPVEQWHEVNEGDVFYQPINYEPLIDPMMMNPLEAPFPVGPFPQPTEYDQQLMMQPSEIIENERGDQQEMLVIDDDEVKEAVNMINEQPELINHLVNQYGLSYTEQQLSRLLENVLAHPATEAELNELQQLAELEKELMQAEHELKEMGIKGINLDENEEEKTMMDGDDNDEINKKPRTQCDEPMGDEMGDKKTLP